MSDQKFDIVAFFAAFGNSATAALENFAATLTGATKSLGDREYWRGYEDGYRDCEEEVSHADRH